MPSETRVNALAGICIVCAPCVVTGEVLKWNVIVAFPLLKTNEFAGVPFTVKSVGLDSVRIHRVAQVDNEIRRLSAYDAVAGRISWWSRQNPPAPCR